MRNPPSTQADYWDRVVTLSRETDGKPTAEQIREAFGMSDEDVTEAESRVKLRFRPDSDRILAFEMLQVVIQAWKGTGIAWTSRLWKEHDGPTEQAEAISDAISRIFLGTGKPDIDNQSSIEGAYRKFSLLSKAHLTLRTSSKETLPSLAPRESRDE